VGICVALGRDAKVGPYSTISLRRCDMKRTIVLSIVLAVALILSASDQIQVSVYPRVSFQPAKVQIDISFEAHKDNKYIDVFIGNEEVGDVAESRINVEDAEDSFAYLTSPPLPDGEYYVRVMLKRGEDKFYDKTTFQVVGGRRVSD